MEENKICEQEIRIVPLQEQHMDRLAELEQEIFSVPWSLASFRELLKYDYCRYLVAEKSDGTPLGIAGMKVLACEGEIDKVMVDLAARRQGIADRLMTALINEGTENGVKDYTLEVRVGNTGAIRLYEKHGFRSEGVRPGFYEKPKEDALIMWRRG